MASVFGRYRLVAVVGLAVVVRVIFLFALSNTLDFNRAGNAIHGSEAYDAYALNLIETGVYGRVAGVPDASIPPIYSYALSVVYALFGRGFVQVGLFHIVLDALAIILLYDIARRLFATHGEWIGLLAGVFTALYPYLIFQNLTLIDTPLWMFWLHLFVWLMVVLRQQPAWNRRTLFIAIAGGLALGLGTLTRPITPPLALLVGVWFLFRWNIWQTVGRLLPVAIMSALIVGVWIVRNWLVFSAFIPMTTTSGANFWQGNSEWTIPVFQAGYDVQWTAPEGVASSTTDRTADAQRFALGLAFWRENPDKLPLLWWTKFTVHWNPQITPLYNPQPNEKWVLENDQLKIIGATESIAGVTEANVSYNGGLLDTVGRPIHALYFGGLLLLALVSVPMTRTLWRDVSLLWFVQVSMTLIYVFFHPSTRYRCPSDPLLFVLSAVVVVHLWQAWQTRRAASRMG